MKIQTDFGRSVERVVRDELASAKLEPKHVDVVESQTNTYAVVKLQLGARDYETRILPEDGTSEESIRKRVRTWITNTVNK